MTSLELAQRLVAFPSVSRSSNCEVTSCVEQLLIERQFEVERLDFVDDQGVPKSCVVGKKGSGTGGLAYFSHTDVVPADPWFSSEHGPFQPTIQGGRLYGRGSCDMKGSIACMLAAATDVAPTQLKRPLYVVCTADEEIGFAGARLVAAKSRFYAEMVAGGAHGMIGEPTGLEVVHAHKGTCGFRAISHGKAAHSSTSHGLNANLAMIPFLAEMKAIHDEVTHDPAWRDDRFDPPVISWNIGINDHTPAVNITPPRSVCTVYCRPMPGQKAQLLVDRAAAAAARCGLEFISYPIGQALFVDPQSPYVQTMLRIAGKTASRTVSYGTDGVMFGAMKQMLVLGPGDIAQAHTWDEFITLEQLERGTQLYRRVIQEFCE